MAHHKWNLFEGLRNLNLSPDQVVLTSIFLAVPGAVLIAIGKLGGISWATICGIVLVIPAGTFIVLLVFVGIPCGMLFHFVSYFIRSDLPPSGGDTAEGHPDGESEADRRSQDNDG